MTPITRKEAVEQGLKKYFTGEACCRGHKAERLTHNSACVHCLDQRGSRRLRLHKKVR